MGYRLTKIYTRKGDDGSTGLADGSRVAKDHARIAVIGSIDELLSAVGLLIVELPKGGELAALLQRIQHQLFDVGSEFAIPGSERIPAERVTALEEALDQLNENLPPLKNFILPGGNRAAGLCHMARSICRRAEREAVALGRVEPVTATTQAYLNRLSDLLFVIARTVARADGGEEILWVPGA